MIPDEQIIYQTSRIQHKQNQVSLTISVMLLHNCSSISSHYMYQHNCIHHSSQLPCMQASSVQHSVRLSIPDLCPCFPCIKPMESSQQEHWMWSRHTETLSTIYILIPEKHEKTFDCLLCTTLEVAFRTLQILLPIQLTNFHSANEDSYLHPWDQSS